MVATRAVRCGLVVCCRHERSLRLSSSGLQRVER
eukprot:COSAG01_NODE_21123_length_916_cov_4.719706_1_plen_33_part_10